MDWSLRSYEGPNSGAKYPYKDSRVFTIALHYRGFFENVPYKVYKGGSISFVDNVDPDFMSVDEIILMGKEVDAGQIRACWYRHPQRVFTEKQGLIELITDNDIKEMIKWIPAYRVLDIYLQHDDTPYDYEGDDQNSEGDAMESDGEDGDNTDAVNANSVFEIGQLFSSTVEFRTAVREYAIQHRKEIKLYTNDRWRVRAKCKPPCEWLIYASKHTDGCSVMVKTLNNRHTNCRSSCRNKNLTSSWLAKRYAAVFRANMKTRQEELEEIVRKDLKLGISKSQFYSAKKKAKELIEGNHRIEERLEKLGSLACNYITERLGGSEFQVSSQNVKFVVDVHLRTCSCRVWQLSATPCVHAVCAIISQGEKPTNYVLDPCLTKQRYLEAYEHKNEMNKKNDEVPVQSVKRLGRKGIILTCGKCGDSSHNAKTCKEQGARMHRSSRWNKNVKSYSGKRYELFFGAKMNMSWQVLRETMRKDLKVGISKTKFYRAKRKAKGLIEGNNRIEERLEKLGSLACNYITEWSGGSEFQVSSPNVKFVVDLHLRTCSCRVWQLSDMPCVHAVCAIISRGEKPTNYVDPQVGRPKN